MSVESESDSQYYSEPDWGRPDFVESNRAEQIIGRIFQELARIQDVLDTYDATVRHKVLPTPDEKRVCNQIVLVVTASTLDEVITKATDLTFDLTLATDSSMIVSTITNLNWPAIEEEDGSFTVELTVYQDFSPNGNVLVDFPEINVFNAADPVEPARPDSEGELVGVSAEPAPLPEPTSTEPLPATVDPLDNLLLGRTIYQRDERVGEAAADTAYQEILELIRMVQVPREFSPKIVSSSPARNGRIHRTIMLELSHYNGEALANVVEAVCKSIKQVGASPEILSTLAEWEEEESDAPEFDQEQRLFYNSIVLYRDFMPIYELLQRHSWN